MPINQVRVRSVNHSNMETTEFSNACLLHSRRIIFVSITFLDDFGKVISL